jgi:hypothetical protein
LRGGSTGGGRKSLGLVWLLPVLLLPPFWFWLLLPPLSLPLVNVLLPVGLPPVSLPSGEPTLGGGGR